MAACPLPRPTLTASPPADRPAGTRPRAVALLPVATHLTARGGTEIRELTSGDDLDALFDLARRAFGPAPGPADSAPARGPAGPARGRDRRAPDLRRVPGGQLVASARYHDMRQWWHGRSLPMAGVAAVMVAPEHRGHGLGRPL